MIYTQHFCNRTDLMDEIKAYFLELQHPENEESMGRETSEIVPTVEGKQRGHLNRKDYSFDCCNIPKC